MDHGSVPLMPARTGGLRRRAVTAAARGLLATTLLVSPRPAVALVRRVFDAGGRETADRLARHAPGGTTTDGDLRYGARPDELLDLHRQEGPGGPLPLLMWIHGGGWVAGRKDEAADYLRLIAREGWAVASPAYTLAPRGRYPEPLRQAAAALGFLVREADRLGIDAGRIVLAGDSAGAQLAAQLAAVITTPGYADLVGVPPPVAPGRLTGVVLACGPYDLSSLGAGAGGTAGRLVHAVLWAYSGRRRHGRDALFATANVVDHLSPMFPPALITVGNADPLREHSRLLAARLRDLGHTPETVVFPDGLTPPLGHEYQFDLDLPAARTFLDRLRVFLRERRGDGPGASGAVMGRSGGSDRPA